MGLVLTGNYMRKLKKRMRGDWYHLADYIGNSLKLKGSRIKRRQKGVCILVGIMYALVASIDPILIPLILISLLFSAVNMSYSIFLSMSEFPPKENKEDKEGTKK